MIRKAKFENFKGLRDVEVTFESRFTVLVGPNGTGKTSVLQGVEFAAWPNRARDNKLQFASLKTSGTTTPLRLTLIDETEGYIQIECIDSPEHKEVIVEGTRPDGSTGPLGADHVLFTLLSPRFSPTFRPKFDSAEIARASGTKEAPPNLTAEGGGLPALMAYLKLRDDEVFNQIQEMLCQLIPSVRKIRVDEIASGRSGGTAKTLLFDTRLGTHLPAEQMPDGTLYILALIVAVLGPNRPKTLLIDDIDMRLHPKAQYELVTLLKKFPDEFPDLQIIATSHSPYILDRSDANEVLVTELADDGSVVVAPLTAHPTYPKWSESMTPGEFWSHTGEGWVKQLKKPGAATP